MAHRVLTPDELREEIRAVVRADAERAALRRSPSIELWSAGRGWLGGVCVVCGEVYLRRVTELDHPLTEATCLECRLASDDERQARNQRAPWNRDA
jgi:hypothetical protein